MKILKLSMFFLFLLGSLACGLTSASAPTQVEATNPPSATPAPPTEIPPTFTPSPIPNTPTPEVQQFFTENFQGDYEKNWSYFLRAGKKEDFSLSKTSDGLLFELKGLGIYSYLVYQPFEYKDVRIDATVENIGVNDNNVTLFCRYSVASGWYEFNIYSSGLYDMFFTKPDSAGNLNYGLIANGGSNKINMGKAINKYSIICTKDSLTLFINGVKTRSVGIPAYALENGKVGVSVSSFGQTPVQVKFREVKISQP
ncbi:MAG: hypothetical protein HYX49_04565 [Chloroflexi bacterium]|nr:hypothetical protein [Chloroflexota bacterium]